MLTRLDIARADQPFAAARGAEMGRFNMGSTVILLFPKDRIAWNREFVPGRTVRMGETLGHRLDDL